MYDVIIFAALVVLTGQSLAQNADGTWNIMQFPDPIRNPRACGREGPSFICDPSNSLPVEKANLIDGLLKSIYNETNSGCYSTSAERIGFLVMMAVVPKMEKYFTQNMGESMNSRFKEAVYFSYHLSTPAKWGNHSNNCNEMAVFIYAVQERVVFTMTRPRIKSILTDDELRGITWDTITRFPNFSRNNIRAANAIEYMVREYKKLLKAPRATG